MPRAGDYRADRAESEVSFRLSRWALRVIIGVALLIVVGALAGCGETLMQMGLMMECGIMPMSFDQCRPAKPHDDAGYKAALYYLACPRVGEWVAEDKWPEDCLPLKARMGVK